MIIIANFDVNKSYEFELKLPEKIINTWNLIDGNYKVTEQLYGEIATELNIINGIGTLKLKLDPLASLILKVTN